MGAYVYPQQEWSEGALVLIQIELLIKLLCQMFGAPTSTLAIDRLMRPLSFRRKFNYKQF